MISMGLFSFKSLCFTLSLQYFNLLLILLASLNTFILILLCNLGIRIRNLYIVDRILFSMQYISEWMKLHSKLILTTERNQHSCSSKAIQKQHSKVIYFMIITFIITTIKIKHKSKVAQVSIPKSTFILACKRNQKKKR